jgi:hypothetical protein
MASFVAKKKANTVYYYYVVESARVDGKPRIVHQPYLGTAERVAALVKDRTAPSPCQPLRLTSASRAPVGSGLELRCLPPAGVTLAHTPLRSFHRSLPPAGCHSPHLPAWSRNRGRRLVSP